MAFITIPNCQYQNSTYIALVVLLDHEPILGQEPPKAIGEATVRFPSDTEMPDVKQKIIKAAEAIWKAHQNQQDKLRDIQELVFPPIP